MTRGSAAAEPAFLAKKRAELALGHGVGLAANGAMASSTADKVPITAIMTRNVVCARQRLPVKTIVRLMIRNHISCVPVIDERGRPRGMVTKSDLIEILEDVDARFEVETRTAEEVMMPLAITLDDKSTVAHAASMMTLEGFHHVMVIAQSGVLIGIVSSQDVVRWIVENDGLAGRLSACESSVQGT
jgi:CBS domain-containing protein